MTSTRGTQCRIGRTDIVLKRGMTPRLAKIDNELFSRPNIMMLRGDANKTQMAFVRGLKEY